MVDGRTMGEPEEAATTASTTHKRKFEREPSVVDLTTPEHAGKHWRKDE